MAWAQIRLPIRERGCGLREAVDRRFGQFMGGMAQSVPALVTRTTARNITVVGRLNSPAIIDLFGEGSFNHPVINPWETLLRSTSSPDNLRVGLQQSWSHLTSTSQDAATPDVLLDEGLLINQPDSSAGFYVWAERGGG